MKSGCRRCCIQSSLLCLMLVACAAGCSGKYFKHVQPKNKSTEIPFIPAFSWEAKQPVADLQFELYRGTDFNVETKQAFGEPILRLSGFDACPKQRVALGDIDDVMARFNAEGIFLTPGYDTLEASEDYVWVLRGTGPKEPFVEAFRFRTRKDYYRPD